MDLINKHSLRLICVSANWEHENSKEFCFQKSPLKRMYFIVRAVNNGRSLSSKKIFTFQKKDFGFCIKSTQLAMKAVLVEPICNFAKLAQLKMAQNELLPRLESR